MSQAMLTRLMRLDDVEELTRIVCDNRDFMAPWEPVRAPEFFTAAGQAEQVATALADHAAGRMLPLVILDSTGGIAGRLNLNNIVRGALQSASVGYWVREDCQGAGLTSAAVSEVIGIAFGDLKLHRLEAGTLRHNVRSQRVLAKNGFEQYGLAPQYLKIAGQWQDHVLFQLLNPDPDL